MIDDLRYALRLLRKTPLFTAITLIIIVLGLTLYMTSYTVEQVMTDKALPFPEGEQYVALKTMHIPFDAEGGRRNHNEFTYNHLKNGSDSYSALYAYTQSDFVLSDGDYASTFQGAALEPGLLAGMEVVPIMGRLFTELDSAVGTEKVVLIGKSIWQDYYNGDENIIGKISEINGESATIIGVLPGGFEFPEMEDLWVPLSVSQSTLPAGGRPFTSDFPLALVGILKEGITLESASSELAALMAQLEIEYADLFSDRVDYVTYYVGVNMLRDFNFGGMFSFITLIILALAVVNLSSLLFIRSRSRQHELAIRSSVGASGTQLAKQVLLESFLICFLGLMCSVVLTGAAVQLLNATFVNSMGRLPFWFQMSLDFETVSVGAFFAALVWLASGLPIASRAYFSHPASVLSGSNKGGQKQGRNFVTQAIVGIEVVLSFFLLTCCGVTLYIVNEITDVDVGIDTQKHIVGRFDLNSSAYTEEVDRTNYVRSLLQSVDEIPEITSAVVSTAPPGSFGRTANYNLEDRDLANNNQLPRLMSIWVSEGYFEELGIQLSLGREFTSTDSVDSLEVTVITENLAQQLWPLESAIGKRIGTVRQDETQWLTIVGIVPKIRQTALNISNSSPAIYRPLSQGAPTSFYLLSKFQSLSSTGDLERSLRLASAAVDRNIAVDDFRLLEQKVLREQGGLDVVRPIFVILSLVTFLLAGIGIYGVIARSIALQTSEIGIRRALGSADFRIILRFLKQGLLFLLAGTLIGGVAASLITSSTLASLSSSNILAQFLPPIFLAVMLLMGFLIFAASYFPARKAVMLEPGDALRYE